MASGEGALSRPQEGGSFPLVLGLGEVGSSSTCSSRLSKEAILGKEGIRITQGQRRLGKQQRRSLGHETRRGRRGMRSTGRALQQRPVTWEDGGEGGGGVAGAGAGGGALALPSPAQARARAALGHRQAAGARGPMGPEPETIIRAAGVIAQWRDIPQHPQAVYLHRDRGVVSGPRNVSGGVVPGLVRV